MKEIVNSKVKCKCGSTDIVLSEVWKNHTITWEQEGGQFDRDLGYLEPGDPYKVEAECSKCRKHWTIRGALQIDDVIKFNS